jgi:hypothetical protein
MKCKEIDCVDIELLTVQCILIIIMFSLKLFKEENVF